MLFRFTMIALLLCIGLHAQQLNYADPTTVLGMNVKDADFISVTDYWGLDKRYQNPQRGLKFYWNYEIERIVSVLLTNEDYELNKTEYHAFTGIMPFGITWGDNAAAIVNKAGEPLKSGSDFLKYRKDNKLITVRFKTESKKRIAYIKISVDPKDFREDDIPMVKDTVVAVVKPAEPDFEMLYAGEPPFKKALLRVLWSARRDGYASIRMKEVSSENFWGYKFTEATNLKVPGEQYNLLYNFPFRHSQTDWVCVLMEASGFNATVTAKYREVEKLFSEQFNTQDGWVFSNEKTSKADELADLKVQHPKWGTIVLDYSKNPKGKVVLYLRTIPFYN